MLSERKSSRTSQQLDWSSEHTLALLLIIVIIIIIVIIRSLMELSPS
jgi:hypothetical protein